MNDYKVIDNFLTNQEFLSIKNLIQSTEFPWYYHSEITSSEEISDTFSYGFVHTFYANNRILSPHFEIVEIILNKLGARSLIRSKANMYPNSGKLVEHSMHVDNYYPHFGALYYLNTNNGYTKLENGEKISSVENRILLFDSSKEHCSTNCTDAKARFNINLNYF